jgi:hypothetical protein
VLPVLFLSVTSASFPRPTQGSLASAPLREPELPFHLLNGTLIQVEGQIGAQTHLKFALDTGASISIVDSKIASKLSLSRQPAQSFNFDRVLTWQQAVIPDVRFGPTRAANVVMLVGHLAEYSEFARNADVIIGTDLLKLANFTIDYDARKIIFHSLNSPTPAIDPLSNCLFLEILIQGRPVRLIADTGFPGILLFEERLLASVPSLTIADSQSNVTVGKRLHAKQTMLRNVVIGLERRDLSVLLVKAPATEMFPGIFGVIGISALNAHRVNCNFVDGRVTWE